MVISRARKRLGGEALLTLPVLLVLPLPDALLTAGFFAVVFLTLVPADLFFPAVVFLFPAADFFLCSATNLSPLNILLKKPMPPAPTAIPGKPAHHSAAKQLPGRHRHSPSGPPPERTPLLKR